MQLFPSGARIRNTITQRPAINSVVLWKGGRHDRSVRLLQSPLLLLFGAVCFCALAAPKAEAQAVYTTDFESSGGYSTGTLHGQDSWQVPQGTANVVNSGAFSGSQCVVLGASTPASDITRAFSVFSGQQFVFVDFYAMPTGASVADNGTIIDVGSSRVGLVVSGLTGTFYAYSGSGAGGGSWAATAATVPVNSTGQTTNWVRITVRQDYLADTWMLYINGNLAAINLGFIDDSSTSLASFGFQAPEGYGASIDDFCASPTNPLFTDSNDNGIPDSWESTNLC
jgi:hypothetical protein